jgi:hypothetical protein
MKRALAALLCVLVVLGAALYLFVVRPLLRPSDLTAVAESALATEDLLLLGGVNVKQAAAAEATRHAVVLLGRFNPTAINVATRVWQVTPSATALR